MDGFLKKKLKQFLGKSYVHDHTKLKI